VAKRKLQRFNENIGFNNLFQPSYPEVVEGFPFKGKWMQEYFDNDHPLILELGCGKGEYTVGLAEHFPDSNFIGMDIKGARMWRGCKTAIEKRMKNVAFIRTRIELIEHFYATEEVNEIWITFPDPHIKEFKARKRLTSPVFLNRYKNILKKENIIHLKTDNKQLFEYTLDVIHHNHHELSFVTQNLYNKNTKDDIPHFETFYEKMWLEDGHNIHYLRFRLDTEIENKKPNI